jgi:aromatic-L-amino-acid/L-tryptophan decarboxylase
LSDAPTLDPEDWEATRRIFHDAVDRCLDRLKDIRSQPVWQETPPGVKAELHTALPLEGRPLDNLLADFTRDILPYGTGNLHPRFFGWVHGAGNVAGALGEMLAGFMNCNLGGRDHVAVYVERQVIDWCKEIFSFPAVSSGLLTSGTSMGTVIALAVARGAKADMDVLKHGVGAVPRRLVGYASEEAHGAIAKSFELLGLGHESLQLVPVDDKGRMAVGRLAEMIAANRIAGLKPAFVVASAGTVNTGAIDDLDMIAALCRAQGLWLHVDAAFGGLALLAPEYRARLAGIGSADSVAFDFHKWLQVPYDAGAVLIRDEAAHRRTFSSRRDYLAHGERGLAGGDPWYCEYGPEMSRGFRALKVWFTIKAYGAERLGEVIARNCRQARHLGEAVEASRDLQLLAPVGLNIVCFRFFAEGVAEPDLDALNADLVADLQETGVAAPSTTRIAGRLAIRICITNHRTAMEDLDILWRAVERLGRERLAKLPRAAARRRGRAG